jgi:hypothetical protein
MTAAYPQITDDLAALRAALTRPAFIVGETVRATLGPSVVTGRVESWHDQSGLLTIHPHGLQDHPFSTIDVWTGDGWAVEHIVEVP